MDTDALTIDWASGEGQVRLPGRLAEAPAALRYDVLADWRDQIELLYRDAEAAAHPERQRQRMRTQRALNERRRVLCERLAGHTIVMAEPLVNGDVLLHLASGKALVLYAHREDVKLEVVGEPGHARALAADDGMGDYYLREEPPEGGGAA